MNKCPFKFLVLLSVLYSPPLLVAQESVCPDVHWQQYADVREAGFSPELLGVARQYFEESGGAALFVVHRGRLLAAWGEPERRFLLHSIRKSLLSVLYGVLYKNGKVDLDATLADLEIDDDEPLTVQEKEATLEDLLTATSGVYLPAAYTTRSWAEKRPQRGSHSPGTNWYYNNWDFNVLATIYNKLTGRDFFEAFHKEVALPLQMEDFRLHDTYYRYELEKSRHPAYLFRMSARDMARIGLLYLNGGKWKDRQLVPTEWVGKSTYPHISLKEKMPGRDAFGYLWWIDELDGIKVVYASGAGGHRIFILPEAELVVVHRTNTYDDHNVGDEQLWQIVRLLLEAHTGKPVEQPRTTLYRKEPAPPDTVSTSFDPSWKEFAGTYRHPHFGEMTVEVVDNRLRLEAGVGFFFLYPLKDGRFYPEDIRVPVRFSPIAGDPPKFTIQPVLSDNGELEEIRFLF